MLRMSVWFIMGLALALALACASRPDSGSRSVGDSTAGRGAARVSAVNGKRFALVIGNQDYADRPLKNPLNDARAMKATLEKLNFGVVYRENASLGSIKTAMGEFTALLEGNPGSAGLFYFAGHGMEVDSINYLLPIGVSTTSKAEAMNKGYDARIALDSMEQAKARFSLVILDACRTAPVRGSSGGLAE
ncbi:MAG: caspase family protein, partial [Candidatus Methylumidiphilus sp.]